MQKWEYEHLVIRSHASAREFYVVSVNEVRSGEPLEKFFGDARQQPHLLAYLMDAGKQGWEVVGMGPIGSDSGREQFLLLLLKRPILSE